MTLPSPVTVTGGQSVVFTVKLHNNTTITSAGDTNKSIRL